MSRIDLRTLQPSTPVLVFSTLVICILPVAQIAIGAVHLEDCPLQRYIPIYLIVSGVFGLVLVVLFWLPNTESPEEAAYGFYGASTTAPATKNAAAKNSAPENAAYGSYGASTTAPATKNAAAKNSAPENAAYGSYGASTTAPAAKNAAAKNSAAKNAAPENAAKDDLSTLLEQFLRTLITQPSLFLFCWFIAGNVWIYSIYEPNYTRNSTNPQPYCDKTLYLFAFWTTTLFYILLGLFLVGGCCVLFCFFLCGRANPGNDQRTDDGGGHRT